VPNSIFKYLFVTVVIAIITASLINYSSFFDSSASTEGSAGLVYHFIMYLITAILSWKAFHKSGTRIIISIASALFILGLCLEIIQIWLPYRTFNSMDIGANIIGLVAGYVAVIMLQTIRKNKAA
jgi:VanZ family protein